jgi:DNA polymerase III subunit chi
MTTRVDFYVLPSTSARDRLVYACRLVEKTWTLDHRVFVRLDTPEEAAAMDDLLWTFADRSFVPHALAGVAGEPVERVLVGHGDAPPTHVDLLVNLGTATPPDFERFERIAELVDADDARRRLGRERFKYYRERGCTPESHSVGSAA